MSGNREMLVRIACKAEPLLDHLVFVGGAVAELYFSDPASDRVRPTDDTDAICEVESYTQFHRLGDRLRDLGFSNPWYAMAISRATTVELESGLEIRVPPPAIYLATKLAAHEGRGRDDPLVSRDLEDIVALLTNRPEIVDEVTDADDRLRVWIADRVQRFLPEENSREVVSAFTPEARTVPGLRDMVLERVDALRP